MNARRFGLIVVIAALIGFGAAQLWPGAMSNGTISGEMHVALSALRTTGVVQVFAEGASSPKVVYANDAGGFSVSLPPGEYRVDGIEAGHAGLLCLPLRPGICLPV